MALKRLLIPIPISLASMCCTHHIGDVHFRSMLGTRRVSDGEQLDLLLKGGDSGYSQWPSTWHSAALSSNPGSSLQARCLALIDGTMCHAHIH